MAFSAAVACVMGHWRAVCKIKEDTKKILEVRIDGGNYRED